MLYINSPFGMVTAVLRSPTHSVTCARRGDLLHGSGGLVGSFCYAAGTKGKLYSLPHPASSSTKPRGGFSGQATDMTSTPARSCVARPAERAPGQAHRPADRADPISTPSATTSERDGGPGYGIIAELLIQSRPSSQMDRGWSSTWFLWKLKP